VPRSCAARMPCPAERPTCTAVPRSSTIRVSTRSCRAECVPWRASAIRRPFDDHLTRAQTTPHVAYFG
jgi:hypothetical protein